jgi:hypothetical protein
MAYPSIGGNTVMAIYGPNKTRETMVENLQRMGLNLGVIRKGALRSMPYEITTITDVTSSADAKAALVVYRLLTGLTVTITDEHGTSWANQLVLSVERVGSVQKIGAGTRGSASTATPWGLMTCRWVMQDYAL